MRKIVVSGCLNCPYRHSTTRVIEADSELPCTPPTIEVVEHFCKHPSFDINQVSPKISPMFLDSLKEGCSCCSDFFPVWCPLDYDGQLLVNTTTRSFI